MLYLTHTHRPKGHTVTRPLIALALIATNPFLLTFTYAYFTTKGTN